MPQEVDPLSFFLFLPFYILNFLATTLPPLPQMPTVANATSSKGSYHNVEEWLIQELPNGTVKMTIHRKASRE